MDAEHRTDRPATPGGAPADGSARLAGLAWGTTALLAWSGWFVVTRMAVTHALGAPDVVALRLGVGAVLLGPALLRGGLPRRAWWNGLLLAACWGAPFVLLVARGIQLTSASHAAAITPGLMPMFVGLIGALALHERPGRDRLAGYAAILVGVAVLLGTETGPRPVDPALGNAVLVLGSAIWALYAVRLRFSGLAAVQAAALVSVISALAYLPYYLLSGVQRLSAAPPAELLLQLLYQGVFVGAVSVVAFNKAIHALGAGAAAAVVSLVPVTGSLLAFLVLGETPSLPGIAAILAISAGVFLAARTPRRREPG